MEKYAKEKSNCHTTYATNSIFYAQTNREQKEGKICIRRRDLFSIPEENFEQHKPIIDEYLAKLSKIQDEVDLKKNSNRCRSLLICNCNSIEYMHHIDVFLNLKNTLLFKDMEQNNNDIRLHTTDELVTELITKLTNYQKILKDDMENDNHLRSIYSTLQAIIDKLKCNNPLEY